MIRMMLDGGGGVKELVYVWRMQNLVPITCQTNIIVQDETWHHHKHIPIKQKNGNKG